VTIYSLDALALQVRWTEHMSYAGDHLFFVNVAIPITVHQVEEAVECVIEQTLAL